MLDRVFREEAGRLVGSLTRLLGDFDLAEELVAEAMVEALEHWPQTGVPDRPAAWLLITARRKGLDRLRRQAKYKEKLQLVAHLHEPPSSEADDRLRLIFTCCHPALDRDARAALALRAVAGLSTREIARAFLVPEPTVAKRITRAKAKIVSAGIPYRIPGEEDYQERLQEVLTIVYLLFNEGFLATGGDVAVRSDLASDAEWLAALLVRLVPNQPEVLGLLALIRLHLARWPARLDDRGQLVLLQDQDRSLWDQRAIAAAGHLIERASRHGPPGPLLLQAAIAAVHCEAPTWADTDWEQVVTLYDMLRTIDPSPVVALNQAIALAHTSGPAAALTEVDALAHSLDRYHLYHATRATFLRELGREQEAMVADQKALGLTENKAERELIERRLPRYVLQGLV